MGIFSMSRNQKKKTLKELMLQNIKELEKDKRLIEEIELRIEEKYLKETVNESF
jgi:parvulin-like peptidyl-prolyl isomerase